MDGHFWFYMQFLRVRIALDDCFQGLEYCALCCDGRRKLHTINDDVKTKCRVGGRLLNVAKDELSRCLLLWLCACHDE